MTNMMYGLIVLLFNNSNLLNISCVSGKPVERVCMMLNWILSMNNGVLDRGSITGMVMGSMGWQPGEMRYSQVSRLTCFQEQVGWGT